MNESTEDFTPLELVLIYDLLNKAQKESTSRHTYETQAGNPDSLDGGEIYQKLKEKVGQLIDNG